MVTTKTIYKCDICGAEVDNASKLTALKIPCRVYGSEGRSTTTSFRDADMCPVCKDKYEAAVFDHFGTLYDTMGSLSFESSLKDMEESSIEDMKDAPLLKDLLIQRKENHANHIVVSTNKNRDLFDGDVSELPEVLLNARIFVWDKKDGIYITI